MCESLGILKQLLNRGYIVREGKEVIFTEKAEKLVKIEEAVELTASSTSVESWIEDYRNLFPRGINSGGLPVRGDRKSCIKKMTSFMKAYPEYDKNLILRATENYVNKKELDAYKYMQTAHYFISKNGASNLAGECLALIESEFNTEKSDPFEEEM